MKNAGFTLMEVLVAIIIMAVCASALMATLSTVTHSWQTSQDRVAKLDELQRTALSTWYDLSQVTGGVKMLPQGIAIDSAAGQIRMLRGGWSNPFRQARSNLQFVTYRAEDTYLKRLSSAVVIGKIPVTTMQIVASDTALQLNAAQTLATVQLTTEALGVAELHIPFILPTVSKNDEKPKAR